MSQVSEQRREQIVATARAIVDEQGAAHLTADAITKQIGVSRPLLYHYFANVDVLLEAVVDEYVLEFEARLTNWAGARDHVGNGWAQDFSQFLVAALTDVCPQLSRPAAGDFATAGAYARYLDGCTKALVRHAGAEGGSPALVPCRTGGALEPSATCAVAGLAALARLRPEDCAAGAEHIVGRLWGEGVRESQANVVATDAAAPADSAAARLSEAPDTGTPRAEDIPLAGAEPHVARKEGDPAPDRRISEDASRGPAPDPASEQKPTGTRSASPKKGLFGWFTNRS